MKAYQNKTALKLFNDKVTGRKVSKLIRQGVKYFLINREKYKSEQI